MVVAPLKRGELSGMLRVFVHVVLIGDVGVGKSHLVNRFCYDEFETYRCPIGPDFHRRTMNVDGRAVKFYVFDTFGAERYRAVTTSYYRDAMGALLVYDVTKRVSFEHAQYWLEDIREKTNTQIAVLLVGNKSDRQSQREIPTDEAAVFAGKNRLSFIETSALDASNIDAAFANIFKEVHCPKGALDQHFFSEPRKIVKLADQKSWKSFCCYTN